MVVPIGLPMGAHGTSHGTNRAPRETHRAYHMGLPTGRPMSFVTCHGETGGKAMGLPTGGDRLHGTFHGMCLYSHRSSQRTPHGATHRVHLAQNVPWVLPPPMESPPMGRPMASTSKSLLGIAPLHFMFHGTPCDFPWEVYDLVGRPMR